MKTTVAPLRRLSDRRRWRQILASCSLDPAELVPPVPSVGNRDVIICGVPRSGTSLLCAALHQPPRYVTVMEPWDGLRLPPAELFGSLRSELASGRMTRGRLDVEGLERTGEVSWGRDGDFPYSVSVPDDVIVGVKWPAFWRYLDLLPDSRFIVCVRHPVEVIASFASKGGRLAKGLDYDVAFNREMNATLLSATTEDAVRRALLFEYIAARIAPHVGRPNVLVVRYERWFQDRAALMAEIGSFLGVELGPGHPVIRAPRSRELDPTLVELVDTRCPSARVVGYEPALRAG